MIKSCFSISFKWLLVSFCLCAMAETTPTKHAGNIAVFIPKTNYQHPVHLLHPYSDVWMMKGPLLEEAAIATLPQHFASVTLCNQAQNADVVLLLEPELFYNPQMRVFHTQVIAKAYTHQGEAVVTVKTQAQQIAELGHYSPIAIDKAYRNAIEQVIAKLENDPAFVTSFDKGNKAETLCPALNNIPSDTFYY